MNQNNIRSLPYYQLPKDWIIHVIDRGTNEQHLEHLENTINNAEIFAFDTETMPSFYQAHYRASPGNLNPSLLQVAVRSKELQSKHVFLFDLQELFDRTSRHFRSSSISLPVSRLLTDLFNHPTAWKLSHSFAGDLGQLKCAYDEDCFQNSKLEHFIELSKLFRHCYPNEKAQELYSLQHMTATVLKRQLNKKHQCANWSKRPLTQVLKDYAAIDVVVMIDIYDRLREQMIESSLSSWSKLELSIETAFDLAEFQIYSCTCQQRFVSSKSRNRHARTCSKHVNEEKTQSSPMNALTEDQPVAPMGRGYLPPALKRAYHTINTDRIHDQVRSSAVFNRWTEYNRNRPPNAQYFLEDDDKEVAQAFGFQANDSSSSRSMPTMVPSTVSRSKSNMRVAAYPPRKVTETLSTRNRLSEKELVDRLKEDFDSQPDFHCHLFGLGGRGRSLTLNQYPPSPQLCTAFH